MGTEILRPQDCLADRVRIPGSPLIFPRRTPAKTRSVKKPAARHDPRRRASEPPQIPRRSAVDAGRNVVMGQVTILRRGESLPEQMIRGLHTPKKSVPASPADDLFLCGKGRLEPEPVFRSDLYAGSACCNSPDPNDLPLPSFSKKKAISRIIDDPATQDLRRLLRLD